MIRKLFIAISLTLSSAAWADKQVEEVPFARDASGRIFIAQEIAPGVAGVFLFDTLSKYTALKPIAFPYEYISRYQRGHLNYTSSGDKVRLSLGSVKEFRFLGEDTGSQYVGMLGDRMPVDGILGTNLMWGRVIEVDPEDSVLRFHASAAPFANDCWRLIAGVRSPGNSIMLTADYMGEEFEVLIATGISHSFIDVRAFRETGSMEGNVSDMVDTERPLVQAGWEVAVPLPLAASPNAPLPPLVVGGWQVDTSDFVVGSADLQERTGFRDSKLIMLGADVITRQHLAIDYRNYQLWVPSGGKGCVAG